MKSSSSKLCLLTNSAKTLNTFAQRLGLSDPWKSTTNKAYSEVEAIKLLQSGKSPGPNGFTVGFYKAFSTSVAPELQNMFNETFSKGYLPPTVSLATITLIAKKDKDDQTGL